ncbi:MAG: hypothetical protein WD712_01350 [Candidatus Spechtbacterales bacterium]
MKTKTLTNVSRIATVAFLLAAFSLMLAGNVLAHGNHSATTDKCSLRATVSATEANDLTGKTVGTHAPSTTGGLDLVDPNVAGDHALICTYGLIKFVTNVLLVTVLVVATLLIAYAAFLFVTAGQSPEKRGKARDFLIFAIVGLVIAAVASLIPTIVRGIIGV